MAGHGACCFNIYFLLTCLYFKLKSITIYSVVSSKHCPILVAESRDSCIQVQV